MFMLKHRLYDMDSGIKTKTLGHLTVKERHTPGYPKMHGVIRYVIFTHLSRENTLLLQNMSSKQNPKRIH